MQLKISELTNREVKQIIKLQLAGKIKLSVDQSAELYIRYQNILRKEKP
jgi:hypothetical protein